MKELTQEQILRHLRQNTVSRNNQLSILTRLLNSLNENTVLAIDGAWGSGKTVFMKQLMMLADENIEDYGHSELDEVAIDSLRRKYKTFYFNAWENDYIGDALSAVLLQLISEDDEGLSAASIKRALSIVNLSTGIKNLSHDFVDFNASTPKEKLVNNVRLLTDRHKAVNDFLDSIKKSKERVIFVIDELDRCRPSFAVDLLEILKHYFLRDDVAFIISTNINELSHTVRKYYGHNFDGYTYLNKFFDFTISLHKINTESYAGSVLDWHAGNSIVDGLAQDAIDYYQLSMRQINSYHRALKLIDKFLRRNNNWSNDQYPIQLIFVPLALALKIKNISQYTIFTNGQGESILRDFIPHSPSGLAYAERLVKDTNNLSKDQLEKQTIDALVVEYKNLFTSDRRRAENLNDFNDAISLISDYTTIPSP